MIPLLAPLFTSLASAGLGLIGNAVLAKGKDVIEEKLGVDIEQSMGTETGRIKLMQLQYEHEEALNAFVLAQREQELKADALALAEMGSARESFNRVQESANASWMAKNIVPILALLVVVGGGTTLVMTNEADVRTASVGLVTMVLGYFFGTTASSARNGAAIAEIAKGTGK